MKRHPKSLRDLFWSRVDRSSPDGCWLWTGTITTGGYGVFSAGGTRTAHRFAYEAVRGVGSIRGMNVCHRCDVPGCCRPEHLFLGTTADNMRDMVLKGRANKPRGEKHSSAKLTEAQVLDIVTSGEKATCAASKHGVSAGLILCIRSGRAWSHVTGITRPGRSRAA